jgi:hypothetical protein
MLIGASLRSVGVVASRRPFSPPQCTWCFSQGPSRAYANEPTTKDCEQNAREFQTENPVLMKCQVRMLPKRHRQKQSICRKEWENQAEATSRIS